MRGPQFVTSEVGYNWLQLVTTGYIDIIPLKSKIWEGWYCLPKKTPRGVIRTQ